jgi:hypothetical protein
MTAIIEAHSTCSDSTSLEYLSDKLAAAVFHSDCNGQPIVSGQRFVYDSGRVYRIDTVILQVRDTFFVVSALRILEYHPSKGRPEPITRYFYTAQGVPTVSVDYHNGNVADSTHYVFSNGDMISWRNSRYDTHFTYYDTLVPASGLLTQQALSLGSVKYLPNKHLLKEIVQNNTHIKFVYDFDEYGNVATKRMTIPIVGSVDTTRYKYICAVE